MSRVVVLKKKSVLGCEMKVLCDSAAVHRAKIASAGHSAGFALGSFKDYANLCDNVQLLPSSLSSPFARTWPHRQRTPNTNHKQMYHRTSADSESSRSETGKSTPPKPSS